MCDKDIIKCECLPAGVKVSRGGKRTKWRWWAGWTGPSTEAIRYEWQYDSVVEDLRGGGDECCLASGAGAGAGAGIVVVVEKA